MSEKTIKYKLTSKADLQAFTQMKGALSDLKSEAGAVGIAGIDSFNGVGIAGNILKGNIAGITKDISGLIAKTQLLSGISLGALGAGVTALVAGINLWREKAAEVAEQMKQMAIEKFAGKMKVQNEYIAECVTHYNELSAAIRDYANAAANAYERESKTGAANNSLSLKTLELEKQNKLAAAQSSEEREQIELDYKRRAENAKIADEIAAQQAAITAKETAIASAAELQKRNKVAINDYEHQIAYWEGERVKAQENAAGLDKEVVDAKIKEYDNTLKTLNAEKDKLTKENSGLEAAAKKTQLETDVAKIKLQELQTDKQILDASRAAEATAEEIAAREKAEEEAAQKKLTLKQKTEETEKRIKDLKEQYAEAEKADSDKKQLESNKQKIADLEKQIKLAKDLQNQTPEEIAKDRAAKEKDAKAAAKAADKEKRRYEKRARDLGFHIEGGQIKDWKGENVGQKALDKELSTLSPKRRREMQAWLDKQTGAKDIKDKQAALDNLQQELQQGVSGPLNKISTAIDIENQKLAELLTAN